MKSWVSVLFITMLMAGCGNVARVRDEISAQLPNAQRALEVPVQVVALPRVVERQGALLPVREVVYRKGSGAWLKAKSLSLIAREPISLSQVVAQFAAKGINVVSDVPLDAINYVGTVNQTDAEAALKQVLGSVGLDFVVDDARKLVMIQPMSSRTWTLNLGNRKTTYASGENVGGLGSASQAPGLAANTNAAGATQGGNAGASNIQSPSGGQGANATSVVAGEDFWGALEKELSKRLTVLVPSARNSVMHAATPSIAPIVPSLLPHPAPSQSGQVTSAITTDPLAAELYMPKKIGSFSLNPETGAITVQAPHWILQDLDAYFRRTQEMFNTFLSFEGRLLLVSSTRNHSEGFDIQHFGRWAAGRYGAVLSNNGLGGVTVGFNQGNIPVVSAGAQSVGGALMGIVSAKDGLQIFNDYLEQLGKVYVLQRPRVATNSGVPGEFSSITPRYYNTVSQTAAAGNTGAATQATSNTIITKEFGTELQIYPRFDVATGLIRAKIKMRNIIFAGEQQIPQIVSVGNTAQTVISRIPLERRLNISGEALLRDGDLVIVGGQSEESLQSDENGLPSSDSANTGPFSGLFGIKTASRVNGTYYFALSVSVKKR